LITSRTRLPLVQEKNYRLVHLELSAMDNDQGKILLEKMLGCSILESEENALARILQQTGCLPLALELLASLAVSPHVSFNVLADRLETNPLRTLALSGVQESPETSVRISLEITYAYLQEHYPDVAEAFVALGVFIRPQSTIDILQYVLPANKTSQEKDRIISLLTIHHLLSLDELDGVAVWRTHTLLHELAKEYLDKDQPLSETLAQSLEDATIQVVAQLRDRFQHNQQVARIFGYLKADIIEVSLRLLLDGQITAALNMLENASSLLVDAGHFAEYQSSMDRLTTQLRSIDLPVEPMRQVVSNFMNLQLGAIQSSLNYWDHARQCWQAVILCDLDDPEHRPIITGQIVKARSFELIVLSRLRMVEAARIMLENAQREFRNLLLDDEQQPEWQEALIEWFIAEEDYLSADNASRIALALYQENDNLIKTIRIQKTMAEILAMEENYAAAETAIRELLLEKISSLSLMVELHIDLAYVLLQMQRPADALAQLDQAEDILNSFYEGSTPDAFARLCSYRAWGSEQSGDMQQAIDQARKSLVYWRQIPDSEVSQKTMLDTISRVKDNI